MFIQHTWRSVKCGSAEVDVLSIAATVRAKVCKSGETLPPRQGLQGLISNIIRLLGIFLIFR